MSKLYIRATLWALFWCLAGVTVSLTLVGLGIVESLSVKASIVAWVLFLGTTISTRRLLHRQQSHESEG